jgi:hypothetical protein
MYGYEPMEYDRFANIMVIRGSIHKFCDDYILKLSVNVVVCEQPVLCLPVPRADSHILTRRVTFLMSNKKLWEELIAYFP